RHLLENAPFAWIGQHIHPDRPLSRIGPIRGLGRCHVRCPDRILRVIGVTPHLYAAYANVPALGANAGWLKVVPCRTTPSLKSGFIKILFARSANLGGLIFPAILEWQVAVNPDREARVD